MVRIMTDLTSRAINARINKFQLDGIRWGGAKRKSSDYVFRAHGENLDDFVKAGILTKSQAESIFDSGNPYFILRMRVFS